MIVRVDDVSPNTDIRDLNKTAELLHGELGAEVWYCVTLFSKLAEGSVYPDLPMRGRPLDYFMDVDRVMGSFDFPPYVKIVSHGLIHAEHGKMHPESQALSIITSCMFLGTDTFVPPFLSWNESTLDICLRNGINLINGNEWRSMETCPFDSAHPLWYFHHWRMNFDRVKEFINACSNREYFHACKVHV